MFHWLLIITGVYFGGAALIYILDGYADWSDGKPGNVMQMTFMWPVFIVAFPIIIIDFLREKLISIRKSKEAKEAEFQKIRIAEEKELEKI